MSALLRRLARRGARLWARGTLILLYHRVAAIGADPWSLAVTPAHFGEHLEILRRRLRPLRLAALARALEDGALPARAVVVTFDDGYADTLHAALPALERHDVPATVFVAPDAIGAARELWWDELDRLLLAPPSLPGCLRLSIGGRVRDWQLDEAGRHAAVAATRWRAWEPPPGARERLYRELWEALHPLAGPEQWRVLEELRAWAGAEPVARPTHRVLSRAELLALARSRVVEIGAHSRRHPRLASLAPEAQREEVHGSKHALEALLGATVASFAYPFGKSGDYSPDTVALVREAGFACACTNVAGAVGRSASRFELPRMLVHDCSGEEFERRLDGWLRRARG